MDSEKMKVLELIQNGRINAVEGMDRLKNLENKKGKAAPRSSGQHLRIRVKGDKVKKVNINIPMGLVKVFSRFAGLGMRFIPEEARREMERKGIDLADINTEELIHMIDQGLVNEKLVDIDINDPHEGRIRVEIYVD